MAFYDYKYSCECNKIYVLTFYVFYECIFYKKICSNFFSCKKYFNKFVFFSQSFELDNRAGQSTSKISLI